jgi:LPXTG-motif cell wall-anchored protein
VKKIIVALAAVTFVVFGPTSLVQANPYPTTTDVVQPPPVTLPSTTLPSTTLPSTTTTTLAQSLPPTGSNIDSTLIIGGSIVLVGAGLVIGVRQRRRGAEV